MISTDPIKDLQRAFRDPASPFHLREGELGPASPHQLPTDSTSPQSSTSPDSSLVEAAAEGRAYLLSQGHDPASFFEQKVVWGDLDCFKHVNNTRYARFLESSRVHWMAGLAEEAGGPTAAVDMLSARGIGLILKTITVNFKRPVVYPDTLLISHRPYPTSPPSPTHFNNDALIYSYAQRRVVATSQSVLVWYDYEKLNKSPPGDAIRQALERRIK